MSDEICVVRDESPQLKLYNKLILAAILAHVSATIYHEVRIAVIENKVSEIPPPEVVDALNGIRSDLEKSEEKTETWRREHGERMRAVELELRALSKER